MEQENKSPEEIEKEKENIRKYALKNIKETKLPDLATAYFVSQEDSGYGKIDNDSVEKFLYSPMISSGVKAYDLASGEKADLVYNSLLSSRQDGRRYSGQISEYEILKTSAKIIQGSVGALKVEDIMSLLDKSYIKGDKIKKNYRDKYLADLAVSENEKDKEVAQALIGGYLSYITAHGVSGALNKRVEDISSGLEKLVREEEK